MRYTLAVLAVLYTVLFAVVFTVNPTNATEILKTKPPGYGTKEICLGTNGRPSYASLAATEQQLLSVMREINRYSHRYAINLSYLGMKEDCGMGGNGLISVYWADSPYVYNHPIHYSGRQSMQYTTNGTPAVFVEIMDSIIMNTADSLLPAVMANPNRLCVALLEQVLHALGLGHEYDVPSATNGNNPARTCALTEDDIEGLTFLYPLDGEGNLHCAYISDGSTMTIPAIAYQGYWYEATIAWNPGSEVWQVTYARYWNAPPYPGCEELLSFDEDLTVYNVPVLLRKDGFDGAMYRLTFSLNVAEMSINVISMDLVSDVGFGVGVEPPR